MRGLPKMASLAGQSRRVTCGSGGVRCLIGLVASRPNSILISIAQLAQSDGADLHHFLDGIHNCGLCLCCVVLYC